MSAVKKMSISIPSDLAERLEPWRDRMNVSGVCADAIRREIEGLEGAFQSPGGGDEYADVIERVRSRMSKDWDYSLGFNHGEDYARKLADLEDFKKYEGIAAGLESEEFEFDLPEEGESELNLTVFLCAHRVSHTEIRFSHLIFSKSRASH